MSLSSLPSVQIFTDGCCLRNPGGAGGCAAILRAGSHEKRISAGFKSTTNNRMEMMALLLALEALKKPAAIELFTDSMLVIYGIAPTKRRKKERANIDLWERIYALAGAHAITPRWIKGHAGHPENEWCDTAADEAARGDELLDDSSYG